MEREARLKYDSIYVTYTIDYISSRQIRDWYEYQLTFNYRNLESEEENSTLHDKKSIENMKFKSKLYRQYADTYQMLL